MAGYACIGLDNPKFNVNVGSVLRLAWNYEAKFVAISGCRYSKQVADTMKYYRHSPVFHNLNSLQDVVPYDCVPVAVDLLDGATPLPKFIHPQRAFYIFGAEDATLGENVLDWCKETVYVPTNFCMNLAITVAVVLYDRMAKEEHRFT